jgi:nucleoside-diphosphate-sugar epimerase
MNVFVAGGSGTIGVPLVRALIAAGHRVHATTRSAGKQAKLRGLGATPVVVDALDAAALEQAVRQAQPTHVIHQLTALPPMGPRRARDLEPTNRLRDEGTRNLLRAAIAARAQRIIVGSFAPVAAAGDARGDARIDSAVAAVRSMESQVIDAARRGAIEANRGRRGQLRAGHARACRRPHRLGLRLFERGRRHHGDSRGAQSRQVGVSRPTTEHTAVGPRFSRALGRFCAPELHDGPRDTVACAPETRCSPSLSAF